MIKYLLTILALVALAPLAQASPTASCTARCAFRTGTTCTAPAYVHLDCIGDGTSETRDSDSSVRPFHDLQYKIDYGDAQCRSGQGVWPNSDMGASRNADYTPIGAHVYECAGTFTITTTVSDSRGASSVTTDTITVEAEDVGWPGARTRCVANGTTPVAGVGGCPAGTTSLVNSADFDASLQTGAGMRTLYKCGDTFTLTGNPPLTDATANGSLVGGYGTCAGNPVRINYTGPASTFGNTGEVLSGWRWRDLRFNVTGAAQGTSVHGSFRAGLSRMLLLRVAHNGVGQCSSSRQEWNVAAQPELNGWFEYECRMTVQTSAATWHQLYGGFRYAAFIGSFFSIGGPGVTASAGSRIMGFDHSMFAHSTFEATGQGRLTIQFRAAANSVPRPNRWSVVSDVRTNDNGPEGTWSWVFCPNHQCDPNPTDARPDTGEMIFENIHAVYGTAKPKLPYNLFLIQAVNVTVRNNIFDLRGVTSQNTEDTNFVILLLNQPRIPEPDNIDIYNNTVIRAQTANKPFYFLSTSAWLGAGQGTGTGHRIRNNLLYDVSSPNTNDADATGTAGAGASVLKSNNVHLNASVEGCPFAGANNACALSPVSMTQNFNEFRIRSTGGSRASVINRGFTFPEAGARKAYVYRDSFTGCRGTATGGSDNAWDIGANEAGATVCASGAPPTTALAPPTLLAPQ